MSRHWSKGLSHFNYWDADLADEFAERINAMMPPEMASGYHYSGRSTHFGGPLWISGGQTPLTWPQTVDALVRYEVDVTELITDIEKAQVAAGIGAGI